MSLSRPFFSVYIDLSNNQVSSTILWIDLDLIFHYLDVDANLTTGKQSQ